jgi:hypothetical protein
MKPRSGGGTGMVDLRGTPRSLYHWAGLGACYGAAIAVAVLTVRADFNFLTLLTWTMLGLVLGALVGFVRRRERS